MYEYKLLHQNHVTTVSRQKFVNCLCEYCLNVQYKLQKINSIAKAMGRDDLKLDNKYEVTSMSLCKSDSEYHNPACVKRKVKECGVTSLNTNFRPLVLEEDKTIYEWHKWGSGEINGKKKPMLLKHTGSVQDLIN